MDPRMVKKSKSILKTLGRIFSAVFLVLFGVLAPSSMHGNGVLISLFLNKIVVPLEESLLPGNNETVIKPIDWKARYYRKVGQFKQLSMELMQVKENIRPEIHEADSMDIESKILLEENAEQYSSQQGSCQKGIDSNLSRVAWLIQRNRMASQMVEMSCQKLPPDGM